MTGRGAASAGPGGQCAELYPEKPIYDIPALPVVTGQELTDRLMQQIKPFGPVFHFGQRLDTLKRVEGGFEAATDAGTTFRAKVVVIAAGALKPETLIAAAEKAFPKMVKPDLIIWKQWSI